MESCVCPAWYVTFQTCFVVRSVLNDSSGDKKYPIWVILHMLSDIQKFILGGRLMYTKSCKDS